MFSRCGVMLAIFQLRLMGMLSVLQVFGHKWWFCEVSLGLFVARQAARERQWELVYFCVTAGVRGRQPAAEELEGHRHLSAGDRGGLLAHHHVCGRPHTWYVRRTHAWCPLLWWRYKNWLGLTGVHCVFPVELPGSSKSRLTVADLYKPEFSVHDPEATWISGECCMFPALGLLKSKEGLLAFAHISCWSCLHWGRHGGEAQGVRTAWHWGRKWWGDVWYFSLLQMKYMCSWSGLAWMEQLVMSGGFVTDRNSKEVQVWKQRGFNTMALISDFEQQRWFRFIFCCKRDTLNFWEGRI